MIQTIQDAEQYLATLALVRRENPEDRLVAVARALDLLGNPQDIIPAIHIAGTSGKGSTAYYASELLRSSGYSVGLAVSPHVNSVAERSQVNGQVLPEGQYCKYFSQFVDTISELGLELSYIEFLTVFSYWLFAKLKLDYMVIEVGLGGRLDPTNTIQRQDAVRAITDIGLDHTEILGDTLAKIATEKAGIIHSGNIVVIHEQPAEVMDVVLATSGEVYVEPVGTVEGSTMPLFQQRNWTLAYQAVARRLALDSRPQIDTSVADSSRELIIPGRFERFDQQDVTIILDAAHNPQKIAALAQGVKSAYPDKQAVFLVAFGSNKSVGLEESLAFIEPVSLTTIATTFTANTDAGRGAIDPAVVAGIAHGVAIDNPYEALTEAILLAQKKDGLLVVTGSFYLIDGIRKLLLRRAEEL